MKIMQTSRPDKFPIMLSILLIFLAILFFIPDVIMYKIIKIGPIEGSAAILFFPLVYSISDSITEVYGREKTLLILCSCYCVSLLFSIMLKWTIQLPSPANWNHQDAFNTVFENGPRVILAGIISVGTSIYVNVKLMSSLKIKMRGRHFIARSIISSSIGELIITIIAYPLIFKSIDVSLFTLMLNAYVFKILYSIIGAGPAKILVFLLRKIDEVPFDAFNKKLLDETSKIKNL